MPTKNIRTGCFLLHGFGGAHYEIEPLANALEKQGMIVCAPLLEGHDGDLTANKNRLKQIHYNEWLEAAQRELEKFSNEVDRIYIIGFSMGGLIGTHLAISKTTVPVSGLILLNTPYYFWDFKNIAHNLHSDLKSRDFAHFKRYLHSSGKLPVNALIEFQKLLFITKPLFGSIECPLLVIQTLDDDSVQPKSASAISNLAVSTLKETLMVARGGHLVLLSESAPQIISAVYGFIDSLSCK